MSLSSEDSRVQYTGNGSTTTPYPVTFVFLEPGDIKVVVTNSASVDSALIRGVDFTVSGGNGSTGNVVTSVAYDSTNRVTIYREVAATQNTVYEENADFPAKSHERALDKLTMLVQQLGRRISQTFRLRESDGSTTDAAKVSNSVFGIGADGLPVFRTASELASFLNLTQQFFDRPTKSFANSSERDLAVPEFTGQIGSQRDNGTIWIATSTSAGAWAQSIPGTGTILTAMLADGVLANSTLGRAKMADGFLSADAAGRAKMADAFITLAKLGSGIFTADVTGRGKFAAGFVDPGLCASDLFTNIAPSGAVLQNKTAEISTRTLIDGSTIPANRIPYDNTPPLITEGVQILSASITPYSSLNKIRVLVDIPLEVSSSGTIVSIAVFRGSTLVGARGLWIANNDTPFIITQSFTDQLASGGAQTYTVRIGPTGGNILAVCGRYPISSGIYDGKSAASLTLQEIKA